MVVCHAADLPPRGIEYYHACSIPHHTTISNYYPHTHCNSIPDSLAFTHSYSDEYSLADQDADSCAHF